MKNKHARGLELWGNGNKDYLSFTPCLVWGKRKEMKYIIWLRWIGLVGEKRKEMKYIIWLRT